MFAEPSDALAKSMDCGLTSDLALQLVVSWGRATFTLVESRDPNGSESVTASGSSSRMGQTVNVYGTETGELSGCREHALSRQSETCIVFAYVPGSTP